MAVPYRYECDYSRDYLKASATSADPVNVQAEKKSHAREGGGAGGGGGLGGAGWGQEQGSVRGAGQLAVFVCGAEPQSGKNRSGQRIPHHGQAAKLLLAPIWLHDDPSAFTKGTFVSCLVLAMGRPGHVS